MLIQKQSAVCSDGSGIAVCDICDIIAVMQRDSGRTAEPLDTDNVPHMGFCCSVSSFLQRSGHAVADDIAGPFRQLAKVLECSAVSGADRVCITVIIKYVEHLLIFADGSDSCVVGYRFTDIVSVSDELFVIRPVLVFSYDLLRVIK